MPFPVDPGGTPASLVTVPRIAGGSIFGASPAAVVGVVIAFDDPWDAVNPTWTRIDDPNGVDVVTEWSIDRGRNYELDKTATGTATIRLADQRGLFDPTNSTSPYYGKIEPSKQAAISLTNPANGATTMLFRGFVEDWDYELDIHEGVMYVELRLVDGLERLAAAEVVPGNYGETPDADSGIDGDILYVAQQVDDRIHAALSDGGWPDSDQLRVIFSGNVAVQDTVYAPRSQILSVIQDAADAEWPGVANFFIAKNGAATFHGRLARFNSTAYPSIGAWKCGDLSAAVADTTKAVISGLQFTRGLTQIINAALASPQNIKDDEIAGQFAVDPSSVAAHGARSWSAENLITRQGDESGTPDANDETKKFSDYQVNNYSSPRNRVQSVTFRPQPTTGYGAATWALICGVEIGDTITVTTTHPGGGGFNLEPFFVEGVHYEAKPMNNTTHEVTLTLDLSPQGFFNDSTGLFGGPH